MHIKIQEFLTERKNAKIKEKIKQTTEESEKQKILEDLEEQFSPYNWLPDAAKRAYQLTIASHPSKFSHPDAKTSSIIAKNNKANDGYFRSGNINYELDVFGNAAALDVYKFLSLKMPDGKTILDHLEQDSPEIKAAFSALNINNYEAIREDFLLIKTSKNNNHTKTDQLVKQIYFPVSNDYHLLSILTPSGLLTELKNKIDEIRFSEKDKEAKDLRRKNEFYKDDEGYSDLFDLTVMKYGGTKPQNISTLNSQNGGRAYLLPSFPPKFKEAKVKLPTQDFFKDILWIKAFRNEFFALSKLIKDPRNNKPIRDFRENLVKLIIDKVLESVFKIRNFAEKGWSNDGKYKNLPLAQKIWLDDFYQEKRIEQDDWAYEISADFAWWIIKNYEKSYKNHETLGEAEVNYFDQELQKVIHEESEAAILTTINF